MSKNEQTSLVEFSSIEIERAEQLLRRLDPVRFNHTGYFGLNAKNRSFGSEFDGEKIKRCHFQECDFSKVQFIGTEGGSCSFKKCTLKDCTIRDTNFDLVSFHGSSFVSEDNGFSASSSGFSYANFEDATLDGIEVEGCTFDSSNFDDARIKNIHFKFCNFENSSFNRTTFENVDLSNASIDYSVMKEARFKNVTLSLKGILHTYFGLQNIQNYPDEIQLKFPSSNVQISFSEFIEQLEDLQAFFYGIHDYFSLSVINIYFGNHEKAYQYLGMGLKHSLQFKEFRMIGYYCKLASLNHFFDREQLRQLYEGLKSDELISSMTNHEYHVYLFEMDRIKRLLIDRPFGLPQINISVKTDIIPENTVLSSEMVAYINTSLERYLPNSSNFLTVRHNSPFEFGIQLSDNLQNLFEFTVLFSSAFFGITKGISSLQKIITDKLKINAQKLDNELKRREIELKELEIQERKRKLVKANEIMPSTTLAQQVKSIEFTTQTEINLPDGLRHFSFSAPTNLK